MTAKMVVIPAALKPSGQRWAFPSRAVPTGKAGLGMIKESSLGKS